MPVAHWQQPTNPPEQNPSDFRDGSHPSRWVPRTYVPQDNPGLSATYNGCSKPAPKEKKRYDLDYNYSAPPHLVVRSYSLEQMHLATKMYIISQPDAGQSRFKYHIIYFQLYLQFYWMLIIKYCECTIHLFYYPCQKYDRPFIPF